MSDDSFIRVLDEKVKEAKENTKWRSEFMILLTREDEIRAESRMAGIAEGEQRGEKRTQRSIYERLVVHGMPEQEASAMTGWNLNPATL